MGANYSEKIVGNVGLADPIFRAENGIFVKMHKAQLTLKLPNAASDMDTIRIENGEFNIGGVDIIALKNKEEYATLVIVCNTEKNRGFQWAAKVECPSERNGHWVGVSKNLTHQLAALIIEQSYNGVLKSSEVLKTDFLAHLEIDPFSPEFAKAIGLRLPNRNPEKTNVDYLAYILCQKDKERQFDFMQRERYSLTDIERSLVNINKTWDTLYPTRYQINSF